MGLDIRLIIGAMFLVLGPILLVTGLVDGHAITSRNGAAMTVFGAVMLGLGVRGHLRQKRAGRLSWD